MQFPVETLRFLAPPLEEGPVLITIDLGSGRALAQLKEQEPAPAAWVFDASGAFSGKPAAVFEKLAGEGVLEYRGVQHPAKGLTGILLGRRRIPLVRAKKYRSAGKLRAAIRSLLATARQRGERNPFLIGIDSDLYRALAGNVTGEGDVSPPGNPGPSPAPPNRIPPAGEDEILTLLPEPDPATATALRAAYLGNHRRAELVRRLIVQAAVADSPVLIQGETGTGKEIVARQIHELSPAARKGRFVAINCAAISPDLFESELFGHVRGAFTGAGASRAGLWEAAGAGTLFLDEIGELTLDHQSKILRALEDGAIRRVGGNHDIPVRARVLAATNRDLLALTGANRFREDLYYRLAGLILRTPPLRSHPEDVPLLAGHFWRNIADGKLPPLSGEVIALLTRHPWRGNVRELKLFLNRLHAFFGRRPITPRHVRALLEYERRGHTQMPALESMESPDPEQPGARPTREAIARLERMDTVMHLRSLLDVIHLFRARFDRPEIFEPGRPDAAESRSGFLKSLLCELDLMVEPPGLPSEGEAARAAAEIRALLRKFLDRLREDPATAAGPRLIRQLDGLSKMVIKEIQGVLEKI